MFVNFKDRIAKDLHGVVEIIVKDLNGNVVQHEKHNNIIKIFAKESLAHRLCPPRHWDPTAGTGSGAWVDNSFSIEDFAARYIVFGASYDASGNPLDTNDARFYKIDPVTQAYVPKPLSPGALPYSTGVDENGNADPNWYLKSGDLINPIPISYPNRPLKAVERIYFESSYQPAGDPNLDPAVRPLNNTVVFETTLTKTEYNGFGNTASDYFTISEVSLVCAPEVEVATVCNCPPRDIFLLGHADGLPLQANIAVAGSTVSLTETTAEYIDYIKVGDTIKIVSADSTAAANNELDQLNPFYLVMSKVSGGVDITVDRTIRNASSTPITGAVGVFKDEFRMFSHRILQTPVKKSSDFEVIVRWSINFA